VSAGIVSIEITMQPSDARIEDIGAARIGREKFISATPENAVIQLRTFGLIILRDMFTATSISNLLDRAKRHSEHIRAKAIAGSSDFGFDETYRCNPKNLGCDLTAIDPWTSGGRSDDFTATSLHAAIMSSFVRSILGNVLGPDVFWTVARVRVVIPGNEGRAHGRLSLHTEKSQIQTLAGLHNIWAPLVPDSVVTNVDCPGIQFYIGRLAYFEKMSVENKDSVISFLSTLSDDIKTENPNLGSGDFFFRPKLKTGDIAIFSGAVPHTAYVPPAATQSRINFDVRIFQQSKVDAGLGPWGTIRAIAASS
jgi:hypothetical protein